VVNYGVPGLSETQFDDVNIICGTTYCYTLTATYANGALSISPTLCGEAISNDIPAAITDFSASVNAPQIDLTWEAPSMFNAISYSVYSGEGPGGSLRFAGNTPTPSFTAIAAEESPTCFRIDYMDQCGNLSEDGRLGCTIFLSGTGLSTTISLQWTPYTGWQNGPTEYLVEKYVNNQLIGTFTAGTNTSYVDAEDDPNNQVVVYVIRAISPLAGLPDVLSNVLVFVKAPVLTFPSAFTPDGNTLNDEFKVIGRYINQYELKIFNRWGEMLFITQNPEEGWDGRYRGKPLPQGSYLYKVEIVDFTGARHIRDGQIMLLRTQQ
jgi:gliding motility-associated-like protein